MMTAIVVTVCLLAYAVFVYLFAKTYIDRAYFQGFKAGTAAGIRECRRDILKEMGRAYRTVNLRAEHARKGYGTNPPGESL